MRLAHRLLLGSLLLVGTLVVLVVALLDARLHTRLLEESRLGLEREARLVATQWTPAVSADALADAAGAALGLVSSLRPLRQTGWVTHDPLRSDFTFPSASVMLDHHFKHKLLFRFLHP